MFFGVVSSHITHNSTTLWLGAGSVVQNYSSKYRLLSIQFIELPYQESFKQFQKLFFDSLSFLFWLNIFYELTTSA